MSSGHFTNETNKNPQNRPGKQFICANTDSVTMTP